MGGDEIVSGPGGTDPRWRSGREAAGAAGNAYVEIDLYDMGELVSRLERLMKGSKRTSALFAHDDYLAARTTVALGTLGFKVPDDVSIIAPGDTLDYNQPYIPRITTMRIDTDMLGKLAGEMMINRLQHRPAEIIVVKVKQQLRE